MPELGVLKQLQSPAHRRDGSLFFDTSLRADAKQRRSSFEPPLRARG